MASRKSKVVAQTRAQAKATYIAKRKKRVRELFEVEGLQPRDIAARLVNEGVIETLDESLESATRLVRGDLKEIRASIDTGRAADAVPTVAGNEIDALERELAELRRQHARQELIAAGEPIEMCYRSKVPPSICGSAVCLENNKHLTFVGPAIGVTEMWTPQGPMTSYKALWPAGVRQKASKDAATLAEKISKLEIALTEKRRNLAPPVQGAEKGDPSRLFEIVASGQPMNELIARNTGAGSKPN